MRTEQMPLAVGLIMLHEDRVHSGDVHLAALVHPRLVHQVAVLFVKREPSDVHVTVRGALDKRRPPTASAVRFHPNDFRLRQHARPRLFSGTAHPQWPKTTAESSIKIIFKPANEIRFFFDNFRCQIVTVILSLGIK